MRFIFNPQLLSQIITPASKFIVEKEKLFYTIFAAKKKIKDETRLKEEIEPRINNSVTDEGPISQGRAAGDPEIIIVGAGVAGAALACSLGKVNISPLSYLLCG